MGGGADGDVSRGGSGAGGADLGDPPGDAEPLRQSMRRASADAASAAAAAAEVSVREQSPLSAMGVF